jgi:hypothetical protein
MAHSGPKSLILRLASALVLCTMIPALTAEAKDIDGQPNKGSEGTHAVPATLDTRQIVVEPAGTEQPSPAAKTETAEAAPAAEAPAPPSTKPSADGRDEVAPATEQGLPSPPQTSPGIGHGYALAYVLGYRAAYGHGYGYHRYQPTHGYEGDYEPAGYGHSRGYEHCD